MSFFQSFFGALKRSKPEASTGDEESGSDEGAIEADYKLDETKYTILSVLGCGSFGYTFKVESEGGDYYALKVALREDRAGETEEEIESNFEKLLREISLGFFITRLPYNAGNFFIPTQKFKHNTLASGLGDEVKGWINEQTDIAECNEFKKAFNKISKQENGSVSLILMDLITDIIPYTELHNSSMKGVMFGMLYSLAAAYQQFGFVHNDISLNNVMFIRRPTTTVMYLDQDPYYLSDVYPMLFDYGRSHTAFSRQTHKSSISLQGTRDYTAPELLAIDVLHQYDAEDWDPTSTIATDVWSVAMVILDLLDNNDIILHDMPIEGETKNNKAFRLKQYKTLLPAERILKTPEERVGGPEMARRKKYFAALAQMLQVTNLLGMHTFDQYVESHRGLQASINAGNRPEYIAFRDLMNNETNREMLTSAVSDTVYPKEPGQTRTMINALGAMRKKIDAKIKNNIAKSDQAAFRHLLSLMLSIDINDRVKDNNIYHLLRHPFFDTLKTAHDKPQTEMKLMTNEPTLYAINDETRELAEKRKQKYSRGDVEIRCSICSQPAKYICSICSESAFCSYKCSKSSTE